MFSIHGPHISISAGESWHLEGAIQPWLFLLRVIASIQEALGDRSLRTWMIKIWNQALWINYLGSNYLGSNWLFSQCHGVTDIMSCHVVIQCLCLTTFIYQASFLDEYLCFSLKISFYFLCFQIMINNCSWVQMVIIF